MKSKGFNPKFSITKRIAAGLTRIERARGFLEAATLSEYWVREMGNRALMLEAHHTTHIEWGLRDVHCFIGFHKLTQNPIFLLNQ